MRRACLWPPREQQIPAGSTKVERGDGVVYFYQNTRKNRSAAIAFKGKADKPAWHLHFLTEARRAAYADDWLAGLAKAQETRQKRAQARTEFKTTLVVGDILVHTWGYEQTNQDFYEVVEVPSPKTIVLRQVEAESVPGSLEGPLGMSDRCVPKKGAYKGPSQRKRVAPDYAGKDYVSVECGWMGKWDGRPMFRSWYG